MQITKLAESDALERAAYLTSQEEKAEGIKEQLTALMPKLYTEIQVPDTEEVLGLVVHRGQKTVVVEDEAITREVARLETELGTVTRGIEQAGRIDQFLKCTADALNWSGLKPVAMISRELWEQVAEKYLYRFEHIDQASRTGVKAGMRPFLLVMFALALCAEIAVLAYLYAPHVFWYLAATLVLSANMVIPATQLDTEMVLRTKPDFYEKMATCGGVMAIVASFAVAICACGIYFNPEWSDTVNKILGVASFLSGGFVSAIICFVVFEVPALLSEKIPFGKFLPKSLIMKLYWPDRIDYALTEGRGVKVNFLLPESDQQKLIASVKEIKAAGYDPCIAVVPEAIALDREDLGKIIRNSLDPIIYTVHANGSVAVHAQVGEFAEEADVMAFVRKHGLFCRYLKTA